MSSFTKNKKLVSYYLNKNKYPVPKFLPIHTILSKRFVHLTYNSLCHRCMLLFFRDLIQLRCYGWKNWQQVAPYTVSLKWRVNCLNWYHTSSYLNRLSKIIIKCLNTRHQLRCRIAFDELDITFSINNNVFFSLLTMYAIFVL